MRSVYDNIKAVKAITAHGAAEGAVAAAKIISVDTFGYNSAMFNIEVGTVTTFNDAAGGTSTDVTVNATVQESDDNSTFTDFPATGSANGTAVLTQISTYGSAAATNGQIRVEGLGTIRKRYLKLTLTTAFTPDDGQTLPVSATALLGRAFSLPTN